MTGTCTTLPSNSGQFTRFSTWEPEFNSPWEYMTDEQLVEAISHINRCRRRHTCMECINYNIEIVDRLSPAPGGERNEQLNTQ